MDRLEALRTELDPTGEHVFIHPLDVTDAASCAAFCAATEARLGGVDILINNAGLAQGLDPVLGTPEEAVQTMLDTNITGVLRLTRALVPGMLERGFGQVVFLGSIAGRYFYEGGSIYCATKHAIRAIAGALRLELTGKPIRVNTIEPGMVETEFSQVRFGGDIARAAQVYAGLTPLVAEDIADCILWVCTRPAHVNIDDMLVTPIDQGFTVKVHRELWENSAP